MPSLQSQIITAAVAALNAVPGGAPAYRCKMTSFQKTQLPAYNVLPEDGEAQYTTGGSVDRSLRFYVRCIAVSADEVDLAVDAIYVAAVQALAADPTLGGLALTLREGKSKWDMEPGEVAAVALAVMFEAEFSTSRRDPSVRKF